MASKTSETNLQPMDYSNSNILENIQELQQLEKQLYTNLVGSSSKSTGNNLVEQEQIIKRINDLSSTRIQLFSSLKNLYQNSQENVNNLRNNLADKVIVAKVMEEQLNGLKTNINAIKDDKNNKLRMVEINTYFGKRYQAHTSVMKMVIIVCLLLLLITTISKGGYLPQSIINTLIVIILVIGSYLIIKKIYDISIRDNMNFDEYNWNVALHSKGEGNYQFQNPLGDLNFSSDTDLDYWLKICGEGTMYDSDKNQCVIKMPKLVNSNNKQQ